METLKELDFNEMKMISGGENVAYEVGYAIGTAIRRTLLALEIFSLFK